MLCMKMPQLNSCLRILRILKFVNTKNELHPHSKLCINNIYSWVCTFEDQDYNQKNELMEVKFRKNEIRKLLKVAQLPMGFYL